MTTAVMSTSEGDQRFIIEARGSSSVAVPDAVVGGTRCRPGRSVRGQAYEEALVVNISTTALTNC